MGLLLLYENFHLVLQLILPYQLDNDLKPSMVLSP